MTDPKTLVTQAIDELLGRHDLGAVDRYFAEPYLQHNPHFASGLAALRGLASMGGVTMRRARVLADGPLVVTHSVYGGLGPLPMVTFDLFRVQDGKIVEHWDVMQAEQPQTKSGRTQTDGPTEPGDRARSAASRTLVQGFFDEVIYGHRMDKLPEYISTTTYHQHNPGVGDGLDGFGKAMAELKQAGLSMVYQKTYRVVAEGDFVFTHSEGIFAGKHVAFADLFRVAEGKIVEHWDAIQEVADQTASGLPMF